MIIDKGALVSSQIFENYEIQTLPDSQWRMFVSMVAYMGEYGRVDNLNHAAFTMRVHPDYLQKMLDLLTAEGLLTYKDGFFYLPERIQKYIEILR